MPAPAPRRSFLGRALGALGAAALAPRALAAGPAALSAEEKKKLKEELQRELERKVYAVDETLFRKVNRAKDPSKLEGHERSHVPRITAPRKVRALEAFTVKVEIGVDELHEMQVFHYVDWISLRVEGVQVSTATLTPLFNRAIVSFELTLERTATLSAQEHCALHGVWESEPFRIEVG